jgi:hypothetical protein
MAGALQLPAPRVQSRLLKLYNVISIDNEAAFQGNSGKQQFNPFARIERPVEDAFQALKRSSDDPYAITGVEFIVEANEAVFSDPRFDERYNRIVNWSRFVSEADYSLHASRKRDLVQIPEGEAREEIAREQLLD